MASINKRPNGSWRARYRDPAGKEHARHFERKVDAERWLTTVESSKLDGSYVDPRAGRLTFTEWSKRWERTLVDLRPSTRERDLAHVKNHLRPRFGTVPVGRITTSSVSSFIAELNAGDRSPATVRKIGQVLSKVMAGAVAEGLIARNPCDGVRLPAEPRREMIFLNAEQLRELAEAIDPWYRVLVLSAGYLGLRWGELAGLRPERVDLLRRRVHVVEQLTEVNGELAFGEPKTSAGRRSVSVPAFLAGLLEEQLAERATTELVFPSKQGEPMRRSNFRRRAWTPAVERLEDAEGLRFHDLRHTAVALAIDQGAHPKAIQERLGHSSITVTLDRYGHLFPNLDESIAEGLDDTWERSLADFSRTQRGLEPVAEIGGD